jgi:cytochrome c-type protein NapC
MIKPAVTAAIKNSGDKLGVVTSECNHTRKHGTNSDLLCLRASRLASWAQVVHMSVLGIVTLFAAGIAAMVLLRFLTKRPPLTLEWKLWLAMGLGVLPAISAGASTVQGMEGTTQRSFCGSCHVMESHYDDAANPKSQSLAARHSRNHSFGERSCYVCHADYGMYGYLLTKAGGLRHVYMYYLGGYRTMPLEQFEAEIQLVKPYDNANCRQCHTGTAHVWNRVPEHRALEAELASNAVSCASAGCHGFAHPFTKEARAKQAEHP